MLTLGLSPCEHDEGEEWLRFPMAVGDSLTGFFENPVTGKGGPSKPLMDELKKNGIKVEIHK